MEGNADYTPGVDFFGRSYGDRTHVIGSTSSPLWVGKKKDVPLLFTSQFWDTFTIWRMYHLGFGLPEGKPWDELDADLMHVLSRFEEHYRGHFSRESGNVKVQEAIIERLNLIIKQLNKGLGRRR